MTIALRPDQLEAIAGDATARYVAQATEYVRTSFPSWCELRGAAEVNAVIRKAMADAPAFGLESSHAVTGLLTLMVLLGDEFASDPHYAWARDLLTAQSIAPNEKIRLILEELTKG